MSVVEIAVLRCQSEHRAEIMSALRKGLSVQARDPACRDIAAYTNVADPDEFLLQLTWESVEAHEAWSAAHRDEWRSYVWQLLAGPPELLGHYSHAMQIPVAGGSLDAFDTL